MTSTYTMSVLFLRVAFLAAGFFAVVAFLAFVVVFPAVLFLLDEAVMVLLVAMMGILAFFNGAHVTHVDNRYCTTVVKVMSRANARSPARWFTGCVLDDGGFVSCRRAHKLTCAHVHPRCFRHVLGTLLYGECGR